jgi:hypothetical protein
MQVIAEDIQKELSLNGLKKLPALPQRYYCSPLSLVPKTAQGKQTGWRRIFDLFPKNNQSMITLQRNSDTCSTKHSTKLLPQLQTLAKTRFY